MEIKNIYSNPTEATPMPSYGNQKAVTDYYPTKVEPKKMDIPNLKQFTDPAPQQENKSFGGAVVDNIDGIAKFGFGQYNNFSNTSGSRQESNKQTAVSTLQGAQLGMEIGESYGGEQGAYSGAIAGAALGFSLGTIDSEHDAKERAKILDKENRNKLATAKARRYNDWQMSQGIQASEADQRIVDQGNKIFNRYK